MAANLTTTYASQILDLLGLSKFKGGQCPPPCPPDKNIPDECRGGGGYLGLSTAGYRLGYMSIPGACACMIFHRGRGSQN